MGMATLLKLCALQFFSWSNKYLCAVSRSSIVFSSADADVRARPAYSFRFSNLKEMNFALEHEMSSHRFELII